MPDHDIDRVLMKSRCLVDAPLQDDGGMARVAYFRRRLRESMAAQDQPGGDTMDNRRRIDILLELSASRRMEELPASEERTQASAGMAGPPRSSFTGGEGPPGLNPGGGIGSGLTSADPSDVARAPRPRPEGPPRVPFQRGPRSGGPEGEGLDGECGGDDEGASESRSRGGRPYDRQDHGFEKLADAITRLASQRDRSPAGDKDKKSGVIGVSPLYPMANVGRP